MSKYYKSFTTLHSLKRTFWTKRCKKHKTEGKNALCQICGWQTPVCWRRMNSEPIVHLIKIRVFPEVPPYLASLSITDAKLPKMEKKLGNIFAKLRLPAYIRVEYCLQLSISANNYPEGRPD